MMSLATEAIGAEINRKRAAARGSIVCLPQSCSASRLTAGAAGFLLRSGTVRSARSHTARA
jgi:hypothetical protein